MNNPYSQTKKKVSPIGMTFGVPGLILSIFAFTAAVAMTAPMIIFIIKCIDTMNAFSYSDMTIFEAVRVTDSTQFFYYISLYSVMLTAASFVLSLISRLFMSNKISNTGLVFSILSFIILAFPWIAYQV